tara:strand:+ start:1079 stop:1456 length:378 start_codon:yes stop_codon:yes gene_type:complete
MSKPVNILYVEDNEGDVELMSMSIERYCSTLNIVLDVAETVEEAKEKFQHDKHLIALIDWNLPDGEGIDVLKFIRESETEMPVFLLSGVITPEHIIAAEKYNPTACLAKDYSKAFFQQLITQING